MLGDLGWWSLRARRDQRRLLYWGNLVRMDSDRLTKKVYNHRKRQSLSSPSPANWCTYTAKLLSSLGLEEFWLTESTIPSSVEWRKVVVKKIGESEQRSWLVGCLSKPKLRSYCKFKFELKLEPYLLDSNSLGRRVLFGLRSGSNRLRIETGRWLRPRLEEKDRVCVLCDGQQVEDEFHFVTSCQMYADLRKNFFDLISEITEGRVVLHDSRKQDIFRFVMTAMKREVQWVKICHAALNFVYLAMKRRADSLQDTLF
jgi:hypothetical protein